MIESIHRDWRRPWGKAMAAHLALAGFPVSLYNRTADNISVIRKRGGIELESYEGGPRALGDWNRPPQI